MSKAENIAFLFCSTYKTNSCACWIKGFTHIFWSANAALFKRPPNECLKSVLIKVHFGLVVTTKIHFLEDGE